MFGSELMNSLSIRDIEAAGLHRANFDFNLSAEEIASKLEGTKFLVNAIGYTAVDKAESEPELANRVNGELAGKLAGAAKLVGAKFLHISTDYVFDGTAMQPYRLTEAINPQSTYGLSKALGEQLVAESGGDYSIFRTSWLYGEHGRCFPKVIAGLLIERESINVVNDQIGAPTWTRDLADVVIDHAINNRDEKLVHAVASGQGSWFDFANEVKESVPAFASKQVKGISTDEYPTPAKRPAWSVLDNSETEGLIIGDWRARWQIAAPEVLRESL